MKDIIKIIDDKFFDDQLPSMILSVTTNLIESVFKYRQSIASVLHKTLVVIFPSPTHAQMIVEPA